MFITFEGIDGCGKSTQLKILKNYLEFEGFDVISIREPGGTAFSEKIREILLFSKDEIGSASELFLFEAARANLVESVIKPALASGKVVLADRFYDSTTAYQGYGRGLSLHEINLLNQFATGGLKPDLTFYFEVPLKIARKRSKGKLDRIEGAGDEFFNKVITGFRELAKNEPVRVRTIDSTQDIETTSKHVEDIVLKELRKRNV